jgi:signal transduction histidine kinase
LFNPFFSTKSKGTGLGLYVIKKIVEEHQGKVTVESKPGEGTKFEIKLPVVSGNRSTDEGD